MTYAIVGLVLSLVGAAAFLAVDAVRSGHLMVMNWRDRELFFLERGADGRYLLVRPLRVPGAVLRSARLRWAAAAGRVPREAPRRLPAPARLSGAAHG